MVARWWIALAIFERGSSHQSVIPEPYQGASGWMAVLARDESHLRGVLMEDLRAVGLRLLEVSDAQTFSDIDLGAIDAHLADNFGRRDHTKATVWGTLHVYIGDGEA